MKKSEMIAKMTDFWLELSPKSEYVNPEVNDEIVAKVEDSMGKFLSFLEYQGMKPPVEKVCPVLFTTEFVWEDEDNLK